MGQRKASWLLGELERASDVVAVGIQETHCSSDLELCQAVLDMSDRWHLVTSPAANGDGFAGLALVVSREFTVLRTNVALQGRVLIVRVRSDVYDSEFELVLVYGYPSGRQDWLHTIQPALEGDCDLVVLGDFNFVTDPTDRSSGMMNDYDRRLTGQWTDLNLRLGVVDAYRLAYPTTRQYSYRQ